QTRTRSLAFHPHWHCTVTGGGLSADETRWVPPDKSRGRYLLPATVMGALFRGKLLPAISHAYEHGELELDGDPAAFARLRDQLYRKNWVVYCKRPFGGAAQVFNYLG